MKLQILASLSLLASAVAQGVTEHPAPTGVPPAGCETNSNAMFVLDAKQLPSKAKRNWALDNRAACGPAPLIQLTNGVLTDTQQRTGYIAANYQFQFDNPPQAGALYTAGFSVCANGSLALGGSAVFWQCLSGSFFNLFARSVGPQCQPVVIVLLECAGGGSSSSVAGGATVVARGTQAVVGD